jgi:putative ATP-binding cassette transporter
MDLAVQDETGTRPHHNDALTLWELVRDEARPDRTGIVSMAVLSGLCNAGLLAIINAGAQSASFEKLNARYLGLFAITISLYILAQRYIFGRSSEIFERVVERIRIRLSDKVRTAELIALEHIGKSEVYAKITQQTSIISQSQMALVAAAQASLMIVFSAMYIASLSLIAFVLTVLMVAVGASIYLSREQETFRYIDLSSRKEVELFDAITHTLDGFKEVRLSTRRSEGLAGHIREVSGHLRQLKVRTDALYNGNYIFATSFFYVLIGIVTFLLPRLVPTYTAVITSISAAILFIIGPLSTLVSGIPAYTKASIAAGQIAQVERELDRYSATGAPAAAERPAPFPAAPSLHVREVEFSYLDREGNELFAVGPLNLTVEPGEILFIVGGNGSGKSTLLKLLTALYQPDRGTVLAGGVRVTRGNVQSYRELFAVIFADFHLFDRLYGMAGVDESRVAELLRRVQIDDKTSFVGGRFTNLDLSTGQKKRVALVAALLEDKPIYVFDEWAADQDPEFRRYFYEELLGEIRRSGKTVVAVTHDDRYFHVADRVVKMEYGAIVGDYVAA